MKATGVVRRIDDLGRIVIPIEIRRSMNIRDGDPLEIFVDKDGDVSMAKMVRGKKKKKGKPKKVCKVGVDKEPGYLYFVDKQGDVSMAKMVRGGKKKKKRKKR